MIKFQNVTKKYGQTVAINSISLHIEEDGIYCFLGQNGAGKTTFLKLLSGQMEATKGTIFVDGEQVSMGKAPSCVRFLENTDVQFNLKISELIETADSLQDNFDITFAKEMVNRFSLNGNKKYKQLSFGMKTMLTTILTLANNSEVVLLDEPVLGMDAIARKQFYDLLLESYEKNPRIIIISTHLVDEIAKIAQFLMVIEEGRILLQTDLAELDERTYTLTGTSEIVMPLTGELNCIGTTHVGNMVAAYIYDERISLPEGAHLDRMSLQDFFISIVGGNGNEE